MAPKVSELLFSVLQHRQNEDDSVTFETKLSMIDIYNETAVDLIDENGSVVELADDEIRGTTHLGRRIVAADHNELIQVLQRVTFYSMRK